MDTGLETKTVVVTKALWLVCWGRLQQKPSVATGKTYEDRNAALHEKNKLQEAFPRYSWDVTKLTGNMSYIQDMPPEYHFMMDEMRGNLPVI